MFVQHETRIMRIAWRPFYCLGFILMLIFSGCGDRQPPIGELVGQAEALMAAGQIENAILILERCSERDPERVDVLESLAFAYAAQGDATLASMTFLRIAEIVPQQPEFLLYAAESLLQAGDSKGAVSQYEAYLEIRPGDRAIRVTMADLHISLGRANEALEALLVAEQIESRPQQRIRIGELYLRRNNLAQAQSWFSQALEGGAVVRDEALLGLLETAVRARRFADAEQLLARLDAEYPGRLDQSPMDGVRDQLQEWRKRQNAAAEAVAALDSRPGFVEEREAQVDEEESVAVDPWPIPESDPPEPASPPVEVAQQLEPPVEVADERMANESLSRDLVSQARSLRADGSITEAIHHYKRALVLNDSQPEVWAELSEAYLETGNDRWAQATASEAVRREVDNPKWILQFLRAAQRTMESDRLVAEMETAYRRFPENPEVILVLARAFAGGGNERNARLLYYKFLRLVPDDHPNRISVQEELRRIGG